MFKILKKRKCFDFKIRLQLFASSMIMYQLLSSSPINHFLCPRFSEIFFRNSSNLHFSWPCIFTCILAPLALTSEMPSYNQILLHTAYPSYWQMCLYTGKRKDDPKIGVGDRFTFERCIFVYLLNCVLGMH